MEQPKMRRVGIEPTTYWSGSDTDKSGSGDLQRLTLPVGCGIGVGCSESGTRNPNETPTEAESSVTDSERSRKGARGRVVAADLLARISKVHDWVAGMCLGRERWQMSVPARPDADTDLLISGVCTDARRLLDEREVLRARVQSAELAASNASAAYDEAMRENNRLRERVWELEAAMKHITERLSGMAEQARDRFDPDAIVSHDDHRSYGAAGAYEYAREIVTEEAAAARQAGEVDRG